MPDETDRIMVTIFAELMAPIGCIIFNRYIDKRAGQRFNGESALWVAGGVGGVLGIAIIVLALWWQTLPHDWTGALWAGAIIYATFVLPGVVMWWGDRQRKRNSRLTSTVLRKLNRGNDVGQA